MHRLAGSLLKRLVAKFEFSLALLGGVVAQRTCLQALIIRPFNLRLAAELILQLNLRLAHGLVRPRGVTGSR